MEGKVGRNDPCPCGSGKKFKKCCEQTLIAKKFRASRLDSSSLAGRAVKVSQSLSGLFSKASAEAPPKGEEKPGVEAPPTEEKDFPKE